MLKSKKVWNIFFVYHRIPYVLFYNSYIHDVALFCNVEKKKSK